MFLFSGIWMNEKDCRGHRQSFLCLCEKCLGPFPDSRWGCLRSARRLCCGFAREKDLLTRLVFLQTDGKRTGGERGKAHARVFAVHQIGHRSSVVGSDVRDTELCCRPIFLAGARELHSARHRQDVIARFGLFLAGANKRIHTQATARAAKADGWSGR